MTFVLSMLCVVLYVAIFKKSIKSHALLHYIGAAILAVIIVLNPFTGFPQFFKTYIQPILTNGGIATAMFVLVMYAGALKNGTKLKKILMSIRAELSIIASTLTFAHNITYGKVYLKHLFTNPQLIPLNFKIATYTSIIMFIIMVPLWITSYPSIRKKMKPKAWKNLQRWAYLFYALIYAHVIAIMVPLIKTGDKKYLISVIVYSVVFGIYGFMRLSIAKVSKMHKSLAYSCLAFILIAVSGFSYANATSVSNVAPIVSNTDSSTENDSVATENTSEIAENTSEIITETLETTETTANQADESTTRQSTTELITTTAPTETEAPTTAPAETEAPTTAPTETEAPTTAPTETEAPTTAPTETEAPTTAPTETEASTTAPTETEAPTTAPTETEAPTTAPTETEAPTTKYIDGTYTASGTGYKGSGSITVAISIKNDSITSAKIVNYSDDVLYVTMCDALLDNIVSSQTTEVNSISGATYSSNGIKEAARKALNQALR